MPTYGAFAPQPERYGGGKRRLQYILDALVHASENEIGLDASGPPYVTPAAPTWIEDMATARMLDCAWGTNARAANEFDPQRTQSMLERWERIFGIVPPPDSTPVSRRRRLLFCFQAFGKDPTYPQVRDDLAFLAGSTFIAIEATSSTVGPSWYPGVSTNPYTEDGTVTAGAGLFDWWSNVLHLKVHVQRPTGMSAATYAANVAEINRYLDGVLPAWCTWSVYETSGFHLDEANVDVESLDT